MQVQRAVGLGVGVAVIAGRGAAAALQEGAPPLVGIAGAQQQLRHEVRVIVVHAGLAEVAAETGGGEASVVLAFVAQAEQAAKIPVGPIRVGGAQLLIQETRKRLRGRRRRVLRGGGGRGGGQRKRAGREQGLGWFHGFSFRRQGLVQLYRRCPKWCAACLPWSWSRRASSCARGFRGTR